MDFYRILQVDPSADPEVIQAAYRRLARKYHPDLNQSPDAAVRIRELNEAYAVLSDPARRTAYDATRTRAAPHVAAPPEPADALSTADRLCRATDQLRAEAERLRDALAARAPTPPQRELVSTAEQLLFRAQSLPIHASGLRDRLAAAAPSERDAALAGGPGGAALAELLQGAEHLLGLAQHLSDLVRRAGVSARQTEAEVALERVRRTTSQVQDLSRRLLARVRTSPPSSEAAAPRSPVGGTVRRAGASWQGERVPPVRAPLVALAAVLLLGGVAAVLAVLGNSERTSVDVGQGVGAALPTAPGVPVSAPSAGAWQVLAGGVGSGPGQFDEPASVAVDSQGNIAVADSNNDRIQKLSPNGQLLAQWGIYGTGPGQFHIPVGVAVDSQGNIYVADFGNDRIQKLAPNGQLLAEWGTYGFGPGQFAEPYGMAVDSQGNIYVADQGNNRIQKLAPNGQFLARWGTVGTGPGQFKEPDDVAVDSQGNIYVAEFKNDRIQKLSPNGQLLAQWGTVGTGPGQFDQPSGVAVDSQGNIYVADGRNDRIQKLSPSGQPLAQWGTQGSGPGQFDGPAGVAVDSQGNVYVADSNNDRIQKLPAHP